MNDYTELTEKRINGETVFKGKIIEVQLDSVMLPNGETSSREVIRHRGAVCVIPVFENGDVLAERQFRYPLNKVITEIPAGKLEAGELPEVCAMRELEEETGYRAEKLEFLGMMVGSPALLDERIYMYKATGLVKGETHFDYDEFLYCERVPLCELYRKVMNGEIEDAKTQIAVLKLVCEKNDLKDI